MPLPHDVLGPAERPSTGAVPAGPSPRPSSTIPSARETLLAAPAARETLASRPSVGAESRPSLGAESEVRRSGIRSVLRVRTSGAGVDPSVIEGAPPLAERWSVSSKIETRILSQAYVERELDPGFHGMSWPEAGLLVVADVLGTGVLAVPGALRTLGWVPGMLALVLCYPLNLYTGLLLERLRRLAPACITIGDLSGTFFGWCGNVGGRFFLYTYIQFLLANYVVVLATSLQSVVATSEGKDSLSKSTAFIIAAAALLPTNQLRTLQNCTTLCLLSGASMIVAIGLCLWQMQTAGCAHDKGESSDIGVFWETFNSISAMLLACAGQSIYLEMMSEMKEPTEFTRSLHVATPILILIYAIVAVVTYGTCGDDTPAYMLDALPKGTVITRIVGVLLFGHTIVSYTINQQVLSRNMQLLLFQNQDSAAPGACRVRMEWFGITTTHLGVAFVLATSVGNFENIVHLIGALFVAPLCYILPLACLVAVPLSTQGFQRPCAETLIAWVLLLLSVVLLIVGTIAAMIPIVETK